jgi:O-antigen ligase
VKAANTGAFDFFGYAVSLSADGNTLAVGAYGEASSTTGINSTPNESASYAGAVYVFTRSGSTWAQQAYVKASNTGGYDYFGTSVSLSADGNTLAVGAYREDSSTTGINSTPNELASQSGAVYLY